MSSEEQKQRAAKSAAKLVKDGQVLGLGTGSTVRYLIEELAGRIREEELDIICVPTSSATEKLARKLKVPLTTLQEHEKLDMDIDGADQVDKNLNMVKGGGGALTREKIVALCSKKRVIIVDEGKISRTLDIPVPVEVLPFSWKPVGKRIEMLGSKAALRAAGGKPYVTDNQNFILDCDFGVVKNPKALEEKINAITGVVENGIFSGVCDEVHVGTKDAVRILRRK